MQIIFPKSGVRTVQCSNQSKQILHLKTYFLVPSLNEAELIWFDHFRDGFDGSNLHLMEGADNGLFIRWK